MNMLILLFLLILKSSLAQQLPGTWELLLESAGIASMHTAITHTGDVILLDRTGVGPSRLPLPSSTACRLDTTDPILKHHGSRDCTAHSALFDPLARRIRPLSILTDTWCSSGQFLPNGTLLQTGGDLDGLRKFRAFSPCTFPNNCDWNELSKPVLAAGRWYATNQILPDGSIIIIGGRGTPSVEFYPPSKQALRPFPFLADTRDAQMDNLYPFVHLLPNGHLFVFANCRSILYEATTGNVLLEFPILDGGPRNYPSGGSSAMLALTHSDFSRAEIVVCGGAQFGVFIHRDTDAMATVSCGRITATDGAAAAWSLEQMPFPRVMGDMVMLPTGEVLIINGAQTGSQGFEMASNPCLHPVLYRPTEPSGLRFMTLTPTKIPRMYHSTANLLPDGRVLVAGSNPHYFYNYESEFPTELRLEAFSPEYLSEDRMNIRPSLLAAPERVGYGEEFELIVEVSLPVVGVIEVNLVSAPFVTHSFSQGLRMVRVEVSTPLAIEDGVGGAMMVNYRYRIECRAPPDGKVTPPGFYMAFAVNLGVPSVARWIQLHH